AFTLPAFLVAAAAAKPAPAPSDDVLHKRAIVIDTHADTTQLVTYRDIDIAKPQPDAQLDLAKAAAGGLDAQFFSIFVLAMRFKPAHVFTEAATRLHTH